MAYPDPAFIPPQWEEWFTISRPKTGFWVSRHIVQSLRKSQVPILPMRTHLQGWTAVLCHHLASRDKSDTQISPSPLCLLRSGISLHCCHHLPASFLSGFSSILSWAPPPLGALTHLSLHSFLSLMTSCQWKWIKLSCSGSISFLCLGHNMECPYYGIP